MTPLHEALVLQPRTLGPQRVCNQRAPLSETIATVLSWLAMAENDDLSILKQPGFWIAVAIGIAPVALYAAVILYWAAR